MAERLIPGKRYRVIFEGVATPAGGLREPDGRSLVPFPAIRNAASVERLPDPAPEWRPGDVVVVRYTRAGTPYTYVRGIRNWPGERFPKTDAQMSVLFAEGKATPVLQAGGVPFDEARIPGSPAERALGRLRDELARPVPDLARGGIRPMRPGPRAGYSPTGLRGGLY